MAVCSICKRETEQARGCIKIRYCLQNGAILDAIKFGYSTGDEGPRCPDCNCERGQFHHPECHMERCPNCHDQLISCACPWKE